VETGRAAPSRSVSVPFRGIKNRKENVWMVGDAHTDAVSVPFRGIKNRKEPENYPGAFNCTFQSPFGELKIGKYNLWHIAPSSG